MNNKNDRRSQRTQQALGDAFVELLMEKGYDALSVKDVIERANVGRSTFYSHYADKEQLFVGQLDRLMDVLSHHLPESHAEKNPFFPSLGLLQHIKEQQKLYRILTWGSGADVLTRHLQKSMTGKIEQRLSAEAGKYNAPIPVIANFLAGSFLSLVKWWLDNKATYSPEEMDEIYRRLTLPGILPAAKS